jgi:hypothetical protein
MTLHVHMLAPKCYTFGLQPKALLECMLSP